MSERVTLKQFKSMPAIVSMMTITPCDGRTAVDVLTFATGRVLVIGRDGIELWPSMDALLSSDPHGDFPEMSGFIEYEEGPLPPSPPGVSWCESVRFGVAVQRGLALARIRNMEDGRLYLRDGCYLTMDEDGIYLWDDDVDRALGLMTWEADER